MVSDCCSNSDNLLRANEQQNITFCANSIQISVKKVSSTSFNGVLCNVEQYYHPYFYENLDQPRNV